MDLHGKTATLGVASVTVSQPDATQSQPVTPLVNNHLHISVDTVQAHSPVKTCYPGTQHLPSTNRTRFRDFSSTPGPGFSSLKLQVTQLWPEQLLPGSERCSLRRGPLVCLPRAGLVETLADGHAFELEPRVPSWSPLESLSLAPADSRVRGDSWTSTR